MIVEAFKDNRNRLTVMKLDSQIAQFVGRSKKTTMKFASLPSYHRLLIHRLADYYQLDHAAVTESDGTRCVIITKTENTRMPSVRIAAYDSKEVSGQQPESSAPKTVMKIMKRGAKAAPASDSKQCNTEAKSTAKDEEAEMQQRELEYNKLRAKIFEGTSDSPIRKVDVPVNQKTVDLLDQIIPGSSRGVIAPEQLNAVAAAAGRKHVVEPSESHLYDRRLYAPTNQAQTLPMYSQAPMQPFSTSFHGYQHQPKHYVPPRDLHQMMWIQQQYAASGPQDLVGAFEQYAPSPHYPVHPPVHQMAMTPWGTVDHATAVSLSTSALPTASSTSKSGPSYSSKVQDYRPSWPSW